MSEKKRIIITALGRQGWAITRQLVKLQKEDYEIYVYDMVLSIEEKRLPSSVRSGTLTSSVTSMPAVYRAYREGRVKRIREVRSDLDLRSHLDIGRDVLTGMVPGALEGFQKKLEKSLETAIVELKPHLIINPATFTGHELYTEIAFKADADYIDLGQDTWRAMGQRAWDQRIRDEGRSMRMVPEAGLAPGFVNVLGDWLLQSGGDSFYIRVGGLPIDTMKGGELHYAASWSLEGVIKEYTDTTIMRRNGRLVPISGLYDHTEREGPERSAPGVKPMVFSDVKIIDRVRTQDKDEMHRYFNFVRRGDIQLLEVCNIEACPTSDGISLMPFDEQYAQLPNFDYKTLRYAGHFDCVERSIEDHTLDEKIKNLPSASPDLVLLRVWTELDGVQNKMVEGIVLGDPELDGTDASNELELGPEPVFSAMQHLTGWPTVLIARALLNYRPSSSQTRPKLFGKDRTLWSGNRLDDVLEKGGVIMPYELIDGGELLAELSSGSLIPQCEFHSY